MNFIEFDGYSEAIINAVDIIEPIDDCPEILVGCFSDILIEHIVEKYNAKEISYTRSANGDIPIYKIQYKGKWIGITMWQVGAPCTVGTIEECIAKGFKKYILFGTCGVLDANIKDLSIIIPNSAIREEGTSFHYIEASKDINVNVKTLDNMRKYFNDKNISYTVGKVWTTDAFYRETRNKFEKMKKNGVIAVDMECSAVAALAEFKNLEIAHFFYSADNLDSEIHDLRSLSNYEKLNEKYSICDIAIDLAFNIF